MTTSHKEESVLLHITVTQHCVKRNANAGHGAAYQPEAAVLGRRASCFANARDFALRDGPVPGKILCCRQGRWITIFLGQTSSSMHLTHSEKVFQALETFRIELPSWGFANTGTRFGKFLQPAAASTIEEKFSDAGQVHALTGVCPSLALHVLWDFADGLQSCAHIADLAGRYGVRPGSINPNYFQEQIYKFGSFGNPDPDIRKEALRHTKES